MVGSFDDYYIPEPNSGCWLWIGPISNGYGTYHKGGKKWRAHRFAWQREHGPIPAGMDMCHKCDVPCCVNPDHLWPGTHQENMIDATKKHRLRHKRLTDQDATEIRRSHLTVRELSNKYGVSRCIISDILIGETFRYVSPELIRPRLSRQERGRRSGLARAALRAISPAGGR